MEINEITPEYNMSITIANDRTNITLSSTICFVTGESLYVEPFLYEGAMLNFDSDKVKVSMIVYEPDKTPFMWQLVHVDKEIQDDKIYHVITSPVSGAKVNRRASFRQYLGLDATISVAGGRPFDGQIKDISSSGFCLFVTKAEKNKIQRNDPVIIEFYDGGLDVSFKIGGRVVRVDQNDRYDVFGCKMVTESQKIDKYIANKQLENRVNTKKKI